MRSIYYEAYTDRKERRKMEIQQKKSLFLWLIRRERGYTIYPVTYKGMNCVITITTFLKKTKGNKYSTDKEGKKEKHWVLQVKGYEYPKKNGMPVFDYEIEEHVEFSEVTFDPNCKFNVLHIYLYCREIIDYAIKQLEKREEEQKLLRDSRMENKTFQ